MIRSGTRIRSVRPWLILLGCAALWAGSAPAEARVQTATGYTKLQAFNGALRFIRIDHGYKVTEKDIDSGYLLFEYTSSGADKPTTGSVEVIEKDDGVSVIVQLPQMPEHHERYLADGLLAKLRSDYGEPPSKRPPSSSSKKTKSRDDKKGDHDGADEDKDKEKEKDKSDDADKPKQPQEGERVPGYRIQ